MMQRRVLLVSSAAIAAACAAPEFKPLEFAAPVPLQDAPSGHAIVYLLRTPHDRDVTPVYFNARRVASLPPETYTAVKVKPGSYSIASAVASEGEASVLTVVAGERRFLYTAVPTKSSTAFELLAPIGGVFLPLILPSRLPTGGRYWRECNEQDAQGLLSISRVVAPAPDAL